MQRGFTLIELVVTMGIIIMVGILFVYLARDTTDTSLRFSNSLVTEQQIQQTLQIMVPEIRSASQSSVGGYPIDTATTSTLIFYTDLNQDGLFERVRYFLSGTSFEKGVVVPTGSPLQYVTSTESVTDLVDNMVASNQIFTYYDATATSTRSTPMTFPVNVLGIKTVKISLVANQGTLRQPSIVGVENEATIRNLRYK